MRLMPHPLRGSPVVPRRLRGRPSAGGRSAAGPDRDGWGGLGPPQSTAAEFLCRRPCGGRAAHAEQAPRARRQGGPNRRRGRISGERGPRLSRLRGFDQAQSHHVRLAWTLYVDFTYGMHWCANAVCGPNGTGRAVLLRALGPVTGLAAMRRARPEGTTDRNLTRGPAKLCQGFGITSEDDGADLIGGDRGLILCDDGIAPPARPGVSGRIGIRQATALPWRWWVPSDPGVSRAQRSAPQVGQRH